MGDISVGKVLSGENLRDYLKNSAFEGAVTLYVEMIGSNERQYGLECYFAT